MLESEPVSQINYNEIGFLTAESILGKSASRSTEKAELLDFSYFEKCLSYCIFFWLGVGNLLPWNAFVTAQPYYKARFCDTQFNNSFENFFAIFFTVSQPVGLFLLIQYNKVFSINTQVIATLVIYTSLFILNTIFVSVTSVPPTSLFAITLASTVCCGFSGAIMNGGLFGLAGMLPSVATSALMNGSSLSGLLISMVNFFIILASTLSQIHSSVCASADDSSDTCGDSNKVDYGALIYFVIACVILASCIGFYILLISLPYVVKHLEAHRQRCDKPLENIDGWDFNADGSHSRILYSNTGSDVDMLMALTDSPSHSTQRADQDYDIQLSHSLISMRPLKVKVGGHGGPAASLKNSSDVLRVISLIRIPAISVFLTFTISLTVFPGIISLIESTSDCSADGLYYNLWVPLLFLFWNFFDFIGRVLAERYYASTIINADNIWILASASALMIPLFLFCKVKNSRMPVAFASDVFPLLLVTVASLLNGFIANLSMIFGPTLVGPRDASLAGTIMVFCLSTGLMVGSAFSFLILYIATGAVL